MDCEWNEWNDWNVLNCMDGIHDINAMNGMERMNEMDGLDGLLGVASNIMSCNFELIYLSDLIYSYSGGLLDSNPYFFPTLLVF